VSIFPAICKFTGFSYPMRGKSLSFYRGKISKKMKEFSLFNHFYILILNRQERYVKSSLQIIQPIVFFRIFRPLK